VPSTLAVDDARIDVDDVPAVDGLTLTTEQERSLVLGAPRALFEAACGLLPIARGSLTVLGARAEEAVRTRAVAAAPFDPPMPPKWTPHEYATWSARLVGFAGAEAAAAAKDAIASLELGALATTPIGTLTPHARRATVVAGALATGARGILLEDPLGGLPEDIAQSWALILVDALASKSWVVFAPRVALTSPLASAAAEAFVVSGSRVDARGTPASLASATRRFVARVHGPVDALTARLSERGATVEADGARIVLDLGETLTTHELLAICGETSVTVVELHPIARALA
jgi:ABC-type taurine transport system ATPase subunit